MADLCKELSKASLVAGKPAANEDLETMEIPTEVSIADPHTNAELLGNLLQDYEHKFEPLPEDQKLTKLCSDAGFSKNIGKGQFLITLDEEAGLDEMKTSCREYTLPRSEEASRARGWFLGNTKIGAVLDVKVCFHQSRYSIGNHGRIYVTRQKTVSWVRTVNGINKCVTETSETISLENVEHRATGKPVAKAKPRPKPVVTLSPISIPVREREWIDINPERFRQYCFTASKFMIRLLRHDDTVHRQDDGAVRFDDLAELFKSRFAGTSYWPIQAWISFLAKGGGQKKRFQYCLNPNSSEHLLYFRAIQGTIV